MFVRRYCRAQKLLLMMKLTVLIILVAMLHVSAKTFGQKITLSEKNASLTELFDAIRQQSGYDFMVTKSILEKAHPVTINVTNAELKTVLEQIFENQPLEYQLTDKAVYIRLKTPTLLDRLKRILTGIDITGRVLDSQGIPLEGAVVRLRDGRHATTTDGYGIFSLKDVDRTDVIIISMIGFDKKEVAVAPVMGNIRLAPATSKLDEVQVIAYGKSTQRFAVGAVNKVSAEEISSQPVANPLQALEGRVPGLLVTSTNGLPGSSVKIQVRGQNTIGSTATSRLQLDNPLFIIDGIPFAPQNALINKQQNANSSIYGDPNAGMSPFSLIDPASIESIEVLKDADATSIYGARGANGVILITTKQGKPGKTTLTGRYYTAYNTLTRTLPLLNTSEYLAMRREAFKNDNITPNTIPGSPGFAPDLLLFDGNRNEDYLKTFFGEHAQSQRFNLMLSGGDALNTFSLGINYGRQRYLMPGDFAQNTLNGSARLHHNSANRRLNIDFSTGYAFDQNNVPGSPSILNAFTLPPNFPALRNPDGSLSWTYQGLNFSSLINSGINPYAYLKQTDRVSSKSFLSSMLISYRLLPGLKFNTNIGYNTLTTNELSLYPIVAQNPADAPKGISNKSSNTFYTWNIEPQLNYDKQLGRHRINVLAGATLQKTNNNYVTVTGTNYTNDLLLGTIAAAGNVSSSDGDVNYKYTAGFGRINYIYDEKYLLNATGRIDGSSRFSPGRQFGKFASLGAGWIFTQENFIKDRFRALSFGKLRASYGSTGNDNVGNYLYTSNWSTLGSTYSYNGSVGYLPRNLENPDFGWSITKKLELGVDLGLFKDRILINADWFRNRSSNQLVQYQLPAQTGFMNVTANFPALVENTGFEFMINATVLKSTGVKWRSTFNLTIPKNKLLDFPNLASSSYANYFVIGQPLSVLRGYKYAGVNPETGIYQFLSMAGTTTSAPSALNNDNKFVIGNTDPKFYGGWRNTFSYKAFSLDVFFEYRKQRGNIYMSSISNSPGYQANLPADVIGNVWQKPGDNAQYQRLTSQSFGSAASSAYVYYRSSDAVLGDASYVRLKTATLSYALKPELIKKIGASSCNVYVSGQNLLLITRYKGNDPETQNYYGVPPLRTFALGADFNF